MTGRRQQRSTSQRKKSQGKKPQGGQSSAPAPVSRLAPQVFSELNALFYSRDPAGEFFARLEHMSLLACPDEVLAPIYAAQRTVGSTFLGGQEGPSAEDRARLLRSEVLVACHHAAETLLRFYFAHLDPQGKSPWMAVAGEVNYGVFKNKIDRLLTDWSDQMKAPVAEVFLGGRTPTDAGVSLPEDEFDAAVDAYALVLKFCAERLLNEAFAYNAAKHGFVNLDIEDVKLSLDSIPLYDGPLITYLSKKNALAAPEGQGAPKEWFFNMAPALADYDLATAFMAARGISAIWNVGRRRFTGQPASVLVMAPQDVQTAMFVPIQQAAAHVKRLISELPRTNGDGKFAPTGHHIEGFTIPKGFSPTDGLLPLKRVHLIVRQQDRRPLVNTSHYLLPVSPRGSQSV